MTGVQTCALPICPGLGGGADEESQRESAGSQIPAAAVAPSIARHSGRAFAEQCSALRCFAPRQNTPRAFTRGVPRQGFNCDELGGTENRPKPLKNRGFCAKTLPISGHLCHSKRKDFKMVPKWCRKSACEGGNSLQIYRNSGKLCLEGNASQAPASGSG